MPNWTQKPGGRWTPMSERKGSDVPWCPEEDCGADWIETVNPDPDGKEPDWYDYVCTSCSMEWLDCETRQTTASAGWTRMAWAEIERLRALVGPSGGMSDG